MARIEGKGQGAGHRPVSLKIPPVGDGLTSLTVPTLETPTIGDPLRTGIPRWMEWSGGLFSAAGPNEELVSPPPISTTTATTPTIFGSKSSRHFDESNSAWMYPLPCAADAPPPAITSQCSTLATLDTMASLSADLEDDGFLGEWEVNLNNLSSNDIDELLARTTSKDEEVRSTVENTKANVAHDHDYLAEDWQILSEFLDTTKSLTANEDASASTAVDGFEGTLSLEPCWLENAIDVTQFITELEADVAEPQRTPEAVVAQKSVVTRPLTYRERRDKNNVASQRSRQTRKERHAQMKGELVDLETRNDQLHAEVHRLEQAARKWKKMVLERFGGVV